MRLVPSYAIPVGAASGVEKLLKMVEVIPSWMYIMLVAVSQLIRLVPSKASPIGIVDGEAKLLKMVAVTPSCM